MSTQIIVLLAVGFGAGLAVLVSSFLPPQPDLAAALGRLDPDRVDLVRSRPSQSSNRNFLTDRVGPAIERRVGPRLPIQPPDHALRMLGITRHQFFGQKAAWAVFGFLVPYIFQALLTLLDMGVGPVIPVIASLATAALFFFLPDLDVHLKAGEAQAEFRQAVAPYIELVALNRAGGAGAHESLTAAAKVSDTWLFRRLREELARATYAGITPWDALKNLAGELKLPELNDLADIMRLSGEDGAAAYPQLRARAEALRAAQLSSEQARAKAASERMSMPAAALSTVFLLLLVAPALLRIGG